MRYLRPGRWVAVCAPVLLAGLAHADTPRVEAAVGQWHYESSGTLASDDPLLTIPDDFQLSDEQEMYARLGVRLGNAWWAPVLRARHTATTSRGRNFVDNSTLVFVDTTETTTEIDFEHLEGLLYFAYGDRIRGEFGGGIKKFDGSIVTTQITNTTLGGLDTATARRDLPSEVPVLYGALYAEPASWLTFGGEATASSDRDNEVVDFSVRFVVRPMSALGLEGGYRQLSLKARDVANTAYDLEFGGPYAGLSFLYGSKEAAPSSPDADGDGVPDRKDRCSNTAPGATVDAHGCEMDSDGDGVPDSRDDCPATPRGVVTNARGCPVEADADRDGVSDAQDRCPDTPAGVAVDPVGCEQPRDADGDGVPDALDQCPGGAAGAVDPRGCPLSHSGFDEDVDGVPDARDQCRRTVRGLAVDTRGCATRAQSTVLQGVTFLLNSSYLQRDSEVLLLEVVEALKAQPTMQVAIQGHTCDLGPAPYNKWLSERRANRVLEFLVRHGIDAKRLRAAGYGEEQPVVPNDDERMRELNRRTVFAVVEQ